MVTQEDISTFSLACGPEGVYNIAIARSQNDAGAPMCTVRVVLPRGDEDGKFMVEDFENAHTRVTDDILYVYRRQGAAHESEAILAAFPPHAYLFWTLFD
jgi:hypothetical protein